MDRELETMGAQQEVLRGMEAFVGENLSFLAPVEKAWQPTDYLPDLTADDRPCPSFLDRFERRAPESRGSPTRRETRAGLKSRTTSTRSADR